MMQPYKDHRPESPVTCKRANLRLCSHINLYFRIRIFPIRLHALFVHAQTT